MSETSPAEIAGRPRWLLPVIIAGGAAVLALGAILVLRLVLAHPAPPLGPTPAFELQPGSCLAEAGTVLDTYTVVDCSAPHPQQVVAEVELTRQAVEVYTSYDSITAYVEHICDRLIEYGLYVPEGSVKAGYDLVALAIPDAAQWQAGHDHARCAIVAVDGSELTGNLYRPMP